MRGDVRADKSFGTPMPAVSYTPPQLMQGYLVFGKGLQLKPKMS
jgi:hypothetical protein